MKDINDFCYTSIHDLSMLLWDRIGETRDYNLVLKPTKKAPKDFDFKKVYAGIYNEYLRDIGNSEKFNDWMRARIRANNYWADSVLKKDASLRSFARRAEAEAAAMMGKPVKLSTVCGKIFKATGNTVDPSKTSVYMFHSILKTLSDE